MTTPGRATAWRAVLSINHPQINSLMSSLIGEGATILPGRGEEAWQLLLEESCARNLRAYWNTRLRSLEAASSVLDMLASEGSSTSVE